MCVHIHHEVSESLLFSNFKVNHWQAIQFADS